MCAVILTECQGPAAAAVAASETAWSALISYITCYKPVVASSQQMTAVVICLCQCEIGQHVCCSTLDW